MSDEAMSSVLEDTLRGVTLGDALGLTCEGLSRARIAKRFGIVKRFHLLGRTGFVSDDTEQSCLVVQSVILHPEDAHACARAFSRSLLGWFARLPWGIGLATLRASLRIAMRRKVTGVASAGNGAAMRSGVLGVCFAESSQRRAFCDAISRVTHTDERAVQGARFVAELAAECVAARGVSQSSMQIARGAFDRAVAEQAISHAQLCDAIARAIELAGSDCTDEAACDAIGVSGFVVHSVPLALFMFARYGDEPLHALQRTIAAGGDTDTNAAIVGGWCGARGLGMHTSELQALMSCVHDGPFGPAHQRELARATARVLNGERHVAPPRFSALGAIARNIALSPVVLAHGFLRFVT